MPILVVFRVLSDSILGTDKLKSILPYKFEKAKSSLTPLFDENFIFQTCVHNSTVSPNNFFIHTMCYNEFQSERHSVYFFLIAKGCTWGKETEKDQTIIKKIIYLVPKEAYSEIVLNIYHFKIYNIFFLLYSIGFNKSMKLLCGQTRGEISNWVSMLSCTTHWDFYAIGFDFHPI